MLLLEMVFVVLENGLCCCRKWSLLLLQFLVLSLLQIFIAIANCCLCLCCKLLSLSLLQLVVFVSVANQMSICWFDKKSSYERGLFILAALKISRALGLYMTSALQCTHSTIGSNNEYQGNIWYSIWYLFFVITNKIKIKILNIDYNTV